MEHQDEKKERKHYDESLKQDKVDVKRRKYKRNIVNKTELKNKNNVKKNNIVKNINVVKNKNDMKNKNMNKKMKKYIKYG